MFTSVSLSIIDQIYDVQVLVSDDRITVSFIVVMLYVRVLLVAVRE